MSWEHRDPSNASVRGTTAAAELEPMGSNTGVFKGFVIPPPRSQATLEAERSYPFFAATTSGQCVVDGIETPCGMVNSENSIACPDNDCGSRVTTVYITYASGRKETHSGVTPSFGVNPDGSFTFAPNVSFTGRAAALAGQQFLIGMDNGEGFTTALVGAIAAGNMINGNDHPTLDSAQHFAQQNPQELKERRPWWRIPLPQDAGQQAPKQKELQPCDKPSAEVIRNLNDLLQYARSEAKEAGKQVKFKSSFSPAWAAAEGVGSTLLWSAIKKAPLTALEVGGSAGIGIGIHALFSFLRDYRNWEVETENAGLAAFQEVMRSGVKRIEQRLGVSLPRGHMWPGMNPCK